MNEWTAFWSGLVVGAAFIGTPAGVLLLSWCIAARRADEQAERDAKRLREADVMIDEWHLLNPPEHVTDSEWYGYAEWQR